MSQSRHDVSAEDIDRRKQHQCASKRQVFVDVLNDRSDGALGWMADYLKDGSQSFYVS